MRRNAARRVGGADRAGDHIQVVEGVHRIEVAAVESVVGLLRFNELQGHVPGITPEVLTERLRQLERDGLIARTYHREIPPRVEYEMTALGQTLVPVFQTLIKWSDEHLDDVRAAQRDYDHER